MAGTGIGNSAGYTPIMDFGAPAIINGTVLNDTISGGVFAYASGTADVISSGTNSFVTSDITFVPNASGNAFTGIAIQTAGSNGLVAVAVNGVHILQCSTDIVAGTSVKCDGVNAVEQISVGSPEIYLGGIANRVGRAITEATSGGYCLVLLG